MCALCWYNGHETKVNKNDSNVASENNQDEKENININSKEKDNVNIESNANEKMTQSVDNKTQTNEAAVSQVVVPTLSEAAAMNELTHNLRETQKFKKKLEDDLESKIYIINTLCQTTVCLLLLFYFLVVFIFLFLFCVYFLYSIK